VESLSGFDEEMNAKELLRYYKEALDIRNKLLKGNAASK